MGEKKELSLNIYQSYDGVFSGEYFEVWIKEAEKGHWQLFFVDNQEVETAYGPYTEDEVLYRIELAPFFVESIVFVFYLVESPDPDLHLLGVRLLKKIAAI